MATETSEATLRSVEIETRWQMLMTDVRRFRGEVGLSNVNSDRWERANDLLEEFAARLVVEVGDDEYDDGEDGLLQLTEAIWADIGTRMMDWAERVDARRAARQERAA